MEREQLITEIESKLRGLRSCDTQATAVKWMADSYKLMEECIAHLKEQPKPSVIYLPPPKTIEVVQRIPRDFILHPAPVSTVVYPEQFLHPGLKLPPKAWTHADTLKLERATRARHQHAPNVRKAKNK